VIAIEVFQADFDLKKFRKKKIVPKKFALKIHKKVIPVLLMNAPADLPVI